MPTEASSSLGAMTQLQHGEDFETTVSSSVPSSSHGSVEAEEAKDTHEETKEDDGSAGMRNRAAAIQQAMRDHEDLCLSTALGESLWLVQMALVLHRVYLQACDIDNLYIQQCLLASCGGCQQCTCNTLFSFL